MDYNIFLDKRLDAVIESFFDGIYITDGEGNTLKVNKAYEQITGLKREYFVGRNMKDLIKENIVSISGSLLAIRKQSAITLQQQFKTGKRALITSSPVFDENGEISLVVTNVRDMTEIYRLQEEVERHHKIYEENKKKLADKKSGNEDDSFHIVCEDKKSIQTLKLAKKVAEMNTTVCLLGESGVGKEVYAEYIYRQGSRFGKSFIKVNCGAIPASLIESQLFGYEKGAFTGADKNGRAGLFEMADGGTIFLDEVGELPLDMQVKLLRVLQEKEVERIGSGKRKKIDVRIIAATNRDLGEMVKKKLFREDLYYRLMVFPIDILPLRERRKDIRPLIEMFIKNFNEQYGLEKVFSDDAFSHLEKYSWPGNIRELQNIVERTMIISDYQIIEKDDIELLERKKINSNEALPEEVTNLKEAIQKIENDYIERAYEKFGNVRKAAESLGMDPSTFVRKRQRFQKLDMLQ